MKKIISMMLALVMVFCQITPVLGATSDSVGTDLEVRTEEKVYANATLAHNFAEDGVFVVLSNKESLEFKRFQAADFPEIGCTAVTDFSSASGEKIKAQVEILSKRSATTRELQSVDKEKIQTYNQVLYLTLPNPGKQNVLDAIDQLMLREDVIYAGPNYIYSVEWADATGESSQNEDAYEIMGLWEAWEITQGSSNVLVGVLDSGIDATHPDLYGKVDLELSVSFIPNDEGEGVIDTGGHGTYVAGIIAGEWDNEYGIRGVAPNVTLVSLDVVQGGGSMLASHVHAAIEYAECKNIPILNLSGGWVQENGSVNYNYDMSLGQTIQNYSGLFVCAAGNGPLDNDEVPNYPSYYNTTNDNMIVVGASNASDRIYANSNYGSTIDIFAPGECIMTTVSSRMISTRPPLSYDIVSGTSFAAPFVTGVAALMLSVCPELSAQEIIDKILTFAEPFSVPATHGGGNSVRLFVGESLLNSVHSWTYLTPNISYHLKVCDCGEQETESHVWLEIGTKYKCGICGYLTNAIPGIIRKLEEDAPNGKECAHQY